MPVLAVITLVGVAYAGYRWAKQAPTEFAQSNSGNGNAYPNPSQTHKAGISSLLSPRKRIPRGYRAAQPGEECVICRGEPDFFPQSPPTPLCKHLSEVCSDCLAKTIDSVVSNGAFVPTTPTGSVASSLTESSGESDISGIPCPSIECAEIMGHSEIQKWADAGVFQKYDKEILRRSLMSNELYVVCLNPSCNAGQMHTGSDDNPVAICYACGAKQCFRHRVEWHYGLSCKQWDKKSVRDKRYDSLSKEWIKSGTRPCPNCHRRIQKNDGCDHMTCQTPGGCGYQFCWMCLAPWEPIRRFDNSRHYDHCKYYSGRRGAHPAPANNETKKTKSIWKFWRIRRASV